MCDAILVYVAACMALVSFALMVLWRAAEKDATRYWRLWLAAEERVSELLREKETR